MVPDSTLVPEHPTVDVCPLPMCDRCATLKAACKRSHAGCLRSLLQAGAEDAVTHTDQYVQVPCHRAAQRCSIL
jgi:hypothetical protein